EAALAGQVRQVDDAPQRLALVEHRFAGDEALLDGAIFPGIVGAGPDADFTRVGEAEQLAVVAAPDLGPALAVDAEVHRHPGLAVPLREHATQVERVAHAVGIARAVGQRVALTGDHSVDVAFALHVSSGEIMSFFSDTHKSATFAPVDR